MQILNASAYLTPLYNGTDFLHIIENMDTISQDSLLNENDLIAKNALDYINTYYKNASLNELAKNMRQSSSNICKIIKKATGYTFFDLLQKKEYFKPLNSSRKLI